MGIGSTCRVTIRPSSASAAAAMAAKELKEIRKDSLGIYNRIQSIAEDALFVENIAQRYTAYPVIRAVRLLSSAGLDSDRYSKQQT